MEKKQGRKASGSGMEKKTKAIFGTNPLQMNDDEASGLIGGIVEKGFSDKPPPPRPSVIPFPVARHRSAGPHWGPVNSKLGGDEDGSYGEDGEDVMDFESMRAYANPIERKKKKDMDFSKWAEKELNVNMNRTVRETMGASTRKNDSNRVGSQPKPQLGSLNVEQESVSSYSNISNMEEESLLGNYNMPAQGNGNRKFLPDNIQKVQVSMSVESQIDEENRARLQGMSADEIVEAQAEITGRLDPALLEKLRRMGEEKLRKERTNSENNEPKASCSPQGGVPHVVTTATSNHTQTVVQSRLEQKSDQASGTLWNAWSERVQAARELRFLLDGTVIKNVPRRISQSVNFSQRDFLRTEGDPGAAGYTIKEAVSLTRSVIPGQRALALHLLSVVLDKALKNIHLLQPQFATGDANKVDKSVDWEAVWAYALGPEPELILSLRMCLDDNHYAVVLACAEVIKCILSCDVNENFFEISEKIATPHRDTFTAPIFRSKPEVDVGFLRGGFWKYNAKPSNILALDKEIIDDGIEMKHTVQDDVVVAGQDFAAGLVRMGILPRIRYLLESDPTTALEDYIVSILIAIARHSPKCANAIMNCERLLQEVVSRFITKNSVEIRPSKIKSVRLLRVLAQSDRRNCVDFIKNGSFQTMTWHLYQSISFLDTWVKSGRENCRLSSALMVEQLRFWKACIQHGCCVSYFSDIFANLCIWLNPPTIDNLIERDVLGEFASISTEGYLVLEALARRLPSLFSQKHASNQISEHSGGDCEFWSWSHVGPMVDIALKWIAFKSDPSICNFFESKNGVGGVLVSEDLSVASLLWVYSAVMHMLSRVLERVIPDDTVFGSDSLVPWLPEFVPKVGLQIIKNGFVGSSDTDDTQCGKDPNRGGDFIEKLCYLRKRGIYETSLASVCCLQGLFGIIVSTDKLIMLARTGVGAPSQNYTPSRESEILKQGILKGSLVEFRTVLNAFMKLVASEWHLVQSIEMFGRGGPAPGVGVGWGGSGGGYWSATVLLSQADARFLIDLLETWKVLSNFDISTEEGMTFTMLAINSCLGVCVTAGPTDLTYVKKAINILVDVSVLKYLDLCIRRFVFSSKGVKLSDWDYSEEDYLLFSKTLASHFSDRWLSVKKKPKNSDGTNIAGGKPLVKGKGSLDTIYEDFDTSNMMSEDCPSIVVEWAHQRLPLPVSWFLSPISTLCESKRAGLKKSSNLQDIMQDPADYLVVAKAGLFFLLGIEALSNFLPPDIPSPVGSVSLVWKLHSLSVILLVGMSVIEEEKSRVVYQALQDVYGNLLHQARSCNLLREPRIQNNLEFLAFQSEIHQSYSTFIETLVEQFSAISYGDLIYGRQVAIYLHRCVEAPVRLAAWNALANFCVLELLPPLENCFADAEGYLEPAEDNPGILEAYAKSWTCGALDRAANRGSVAYRLVIHHLSAFIFSPCTGEMLLLRNKLARSLLRDVSRKQQHEAMMLNLVQYNKPPPSQMTNQENGAEMVNGIEQRLELLNQTCERNSSLLAAVEKLKASLKSDDHRR